MRINQTISRCVSECFIIPHRFMILILSLLGVFALSATAFAVFPDGTGDPVECFAYLPAVGGPICDFNICPEGYGCGVTGIDWDNDGLFDEITVFCVPPPDSLGVL